MLRATEESISIHDNGTGIFAMRSLVLVIQKLVIVIQLNFPNYASNQVSRAIQKGKIVVVSSR